MTDAERIESLESAVRSLLVVASYQFRLEGDRRELNEKENQAYCLAHEKAARAIRNHSLNEATGLFGQRHEQTY